MFDILGVLVVALFIGAVAVLVVALAMLLWQIDKYFNK